MNDTRQHLLDNVLAVVEEIEQINSGELDAIDWINDQLCIETVMRSPSGDFMGVEITCCYGGPTVRLDTRWGTVEGHWGSDHIDRSVDCSELNSILEELYA